MTDLSLLNSGRLQSVGPTGINIRGLAAGGVVASGIYLPATFDTSTGELTVLGSLGGVTNVGFSGVATAVNDYGLATGYSYTDPLNRHGFLYADGMMVDIGSLGGYSAGLDINRAGVIVGFSAADTSGRAHAFVFKDGFMTDIDPHRSDMSESYARGINSRGTVVGEFLLQDQSAFHAFLYRDGVFRDIGVLDSPATVAFAINDEGHVVGTTLVAFEDVCFDPSNGGYVACTKYAQSAFVYRDGLVSDLNALIPAGSSIKLEWAIDINNRGRIVGYGSTDERFRAFLLTPAVDETQCKRGAWASFGFKDDRQCIQFVSAGK